MRLSFKIFLILLLPLASHAQFDPNWGYINNFQVDSLRKAIVHEKNDTMLMEAYRSLGFYYQDGKRDSSAYFHELQLKLSQKLKLRIWEADAYTQLAYMYDKLGDVTKAYESILNSEKITADEKSETSNWHPWVFSNAKNMHDARLAVIGINKHALANLYGSVSERDKQRALYFDVIRIGEESHNGKLIALGYARLASTYENDSILLYIRQADRYAKAAGYKRYLGTYQVQQARAFYFKNNADSIMKYGMATIAPSLEQNNYVSLTYGYLTVSIAYMLKGNKDSALYYSKKSFDASSEFAEDDKPVALANLAKVYSFAGNIDSAYKYEKMSNQVNDSVNKVRIKQLSDYQKFAFNEQLRLKKINDEKTAAQNRLMLYGAIGVLLAVLIITFILYKNNRQKQKTNQQLESTLTNLKSTQAQLIQSEKMASLGELTAGIAHEIQNPLNFVNNFSDVSNELITEMKEELDKGDITEAKAIADDVQQNLQKINHHGKRADAIVKGMLQHSRSSDGKKEPTDINKLADEYLRLAYHGIRAKDNSFNATLKTDFDNSIGNINIVSQDIGRVLLNLITNSFYAIAQKQKECQPELVEGGVKYEPTVYVQTKKINNSVVIIIQDNGTGIPKEIIEKIFQPFFTTKPTGQATGLGLSLSYDIIKAHQGTLTVESKPSEYAKFTITLPV